MGVDLRKVSICFEVACSVGCFMEVRFCVSVACRVGCFMEVKTSTDLARGPQVLGLDVGFRGAYVEELG